jgi:glycosyltransferase involved in cell wall biosynthesis
MKILHTESSTGWGGQEMRILRESIGMRERGHEMILAVHRGGKLIEKARKEGFIVYELSFNKSAAAITILKLIAILKKHGIDIVITHSSLDAWISGIAARIAGKKVVRTRHLSTSIRGGLNSFLLYKCLVDFVVTTSSCIVPLIAEASGLKRECLKCIPTGINPSSLVMDPEQIAQFRHSLGLSAQDILVGTCCFVRSWKGIDTLLRAAQLLQQHKEIKWVVVGGGHVDDYRPKAYAMGLEKSVIFTGHLDTPYSAIGAMDIFVLLSTANEGISQASLQAAYLSRPLITTPVGGLPEVCIEGKTGMIVPVFSPEKTAEAVLALARDPHRRRSLGAQAKALVEERFTLKHTLDQMEDVCFTVHQKIR